jgi:hypothetical protein
MTGLDLATSAAKGALSLVLLTASGYAQTHKVLTMTPIATAPPRRRRRDVHRRSDVLSSLVEEVAEIAAHT